MNQLWLQAFIYQHKQAWASLKKRPGFIATIVSTMGFTLGTLLCVLTLAYVLIVSPLPYPEQASLYRVDSVFVKGKSEEVGNFFTYPGAIELHKNQQLFSKTAILFYGETKIESDSVQPNVLTTYATPEWFSLLGAKMELGRAFGISEAIDTNNPVVVLTYQTWKTYFASDNNVLDKSITLSGKSYRVIGVLADTFVEPRLREDGKKTEVFLPWDFNSAKAEREYSWGQPHPDIVFVGNLSSGQNKSQADQRLTERVNSTWSEKVAGLDFWKDYHIQIKLQPFKALILGKVEKAVYLLILAVVGLVLIALANISNLFMARIAEQQRQLSIRAALGATSHQIFKSFLAETSQLMLASIVVALVIADAGFYLLQRFFAPSLPRVEELSINGFTIGVAILISIALALVFARLSSRMINYRSLQTGLQTSGKGSGSQVSTRARKLLIICQVAVAAALIFINLNIFREAYKVIYQSIGFETKNTYVLYLGSWAENAQSATPAIADIAQRLASLPQVNGVSQSYSPLDLFDYFSHKPINSDESIMVQTLPIDEKYFGLIDQPLVAGRNFTQAEARDSGKVIIIDQAYAKHIAPAGDPLGLQIQLDNEKVPSTVVGVVKSLSLPNETESPMRTYYPFPADKFRLKILLKLKDGQVLTPPQIIKIIKDVGGQVSFWKLTSLDERRNELLFTQFTTAVTSSLLVMVSYLLATIGIYGVLNYSVQLRRFELGVRMAIGARPNTVFMHVLKDNLKPVIIGLIAALTVVLCLSFWVQTTNYKIQTNVWICLAPVVLILSLTAATSLLSVWNIIRKPANYALRSD